MTASSRTRLLALAILPLLGAGCAKAPAASPSPSAASEQAPTAQESAADASAEAGYVPVYTVYPCELITPKDAADILGGPVNPPYTKAEGEPLHTFCRYFTTQESDLSRIMEVSAYESDNILHSLYEITAQEYFDRFKLVAKASRAETFAAVAGLGDDAYWDAESIRLRKGTVVLNVSARGFGNGGEDTVQKNKEATLKLAQMILSRLK